MPEPTKTELQKFGDAVEELRTEVKKVRQDPEKIERLNTFLDEHEEKFNQPLVQALEAQKTADAEIKELKETIEAAGLTQAEAKGRVDALEMELARRGSGGAAEQSYRDGDEFKALQEWCVRGDHLEHESKQLLRTDSQAEGGFLVPAEMDSQITKKITEIDAIRSIARVRTTGAKSLEMPIRNTIPVATYEGEAESDDLSTATYENTTVVPFRQGFTTPITWDMLQDAAFDMEAEITSDASEAFAFGEGQNFVLGDGFKKPQGFVSDPRVQAGARQTAASGVLDPESIILLTGDLKVGYDPVYVLNRRTLALIRTFRADAVSAGDSASGFLWQPGLNGPVSNTLNGFPYILANSMPDVAAGAYSIAFGDFRRGYTIVDRTGMSIIRDDVTRKRNAIVEFTMHRWNTGQVTLVEPLKLLQILP